MKNNDFKPHAIVANGVTFAVASTKLIAEQHAQVYGYPKNKDVVVVPAKDCHFEDLK